MNRKQKSQLVYEEDDYINPLTTIFRKNSIVNRKNKSSLNQIEVDKNDSQSLDGIIPLVIQRGYIKNGKSEQFIESMKNDTNDYGNYIDDDEKIGSTIKEIERNQKEYTSDSQNYGYLIDNTTILYADESEIERITENI